MIVSVIIIVTALIGSILGPSLTILLSIGWCLYINKDKLSLIIFEKELQTIINNVLYEKYDYRINDNNLDNSRKPNIIKSSIIKSSIIKLNKNDFL